MYDKNEIYTEDMRKSSIIALCLTLCVALTAWCAPEVVAERLDSTVQQAPVVSLVTFYPGDDPFSIYGHTELRVESGNHDYYYNYGVYDFNSPGFVFRFIRGDAPYYCVAIPAKYATLGMEGRRMVEQELNLTPDEANKVNFMLMDNVLPGNNTYEYRYLTDNCATRPLEIIQRALGYNLVFDEAREEDLKKNPITYRDILRHYGANYAWQQFGIDLVLGADLDKPLDQKQTAFIPMELMRLVADAKRSDALPVVKTTAVVVDGDEQGLVQPPTPWWCSPLAVALIVLALTLFFTLRDIRRSKITAWFDTLLYGSPAIIGCVITMLAIFSNHEAVWPNKNILWLHPLLFIPAFMVYGKHKKAMLCLYNYHIIHFLAMGVLLLSWPFIQQHGNVAFFPLMVASMVRSMCHIIVGKRTIMQDARMKKSWLYAMGLWCLLFLGLIMFV